jgi:hypothetical protein
MFLCYGLKKGSPFIDKTGCVLYNHITQWKVGGEALAVSLRLGWIFGNLLGYKYLKRSEMMEKMLAMEAFKQIFGVDAEDLFTAAGRINVIGEHVDYCGGKVFPAALNLRCNIYARKTGGKRVRMAFRGIDGIVELNVDTLDEYRRLKIGNYQAGVAYFLQKEGVEIVGCDLFYDCTVPFGSGLSSSAAIEVATAVAFCEYAGVAYDKVAKDSDRDYWMTAAEAKEYGMIDEVLIRAKH